MFSAALRFDLKYETAMGLLLNMFPLVCLDDRLSECPFHSEPLQWGRSNLVDPAEWQKIGLQNQDFGSILSVFPRKNRQNTEFTKFSSVRTPDIY